MSTARRRSALAWVAAGIGLALASTCSAARPAPLADPATEPLPAPTTRAATRPAMPPDVLARLQQAELGELDAPAVAPLLPQAQALIEEYFATPSAAGRKQIVGAIDALRLPPEVIGRLTRVRWSWPDMAGGAYYVNDDVGPHHVRYFLGVPRAYDRTRAWPLVIKLPTAHAFLTDPPPDGKRVAEIYSQWAIDELTAHPDAVVVMPLLNLDELYGPSTAGMNTVIQPMLDAANRLNIDPARVYLVGHSMGGHAAWNLALHYPTYFAAINVLAGGAAEDWQRLRMANLRNVLPVVWHDASDEVVPVDQARSLVNILRRFQMDVDYTETKSVGHAPGPEVAEQCYVKTRARTRELYPKEVTLQSNRPDTMFNRSDWVQVYQPINPGPEHRLLIPRSTGRVVVAQNPWKIDAKLSRNTVTVTTENVDAMRFYFNDQTIDFSRSVRIVINGKSRFEGMVTPDTSEMLADQLFLGRGWRHYTGVVDVQLMQTPPRRPATSEPAATGPAATVPAPATRGTIEVITPEGETRTVQPGAGK